MLETSAMPIPLFWGVKPIIQELDIYQLRNFILPFRKAFRPKTIWRSSFHRMLNLYTEKSSMLKNLDCNTAKPTVAEDTPLPLLYFPGFIIYHTTLNSGRFSVVLGSSIDLTIGIKRYKVLEKQPCWHNRCRSYTTSVLPAPERLPRHRFDSEWKGAGVRLF